MYIPKSFALTDESEIERIFREFSFATLVTNDENGLQASHLPFEFDAERNVLISHMARANPQWRAFQNSETEALVIFQGPHGYISPQWYETELAVPTWNYVVVHVYGKPRIVEDDAEVVALLERLVAANEAQFENPWRLEAPDDWQAKMRRAIVGIEIPVSRVEAKAKMSQNRPANDVLGVIEGLEAKGQTELAKWVQQLNRTEAA